MSFRFSAMVVALLAMGFGVACAATAPMPAPKKPDFATFAFLVGRWSCTSKETDRPMRQPWTQTWAVDPKGYWLRGTADYPPEKWFPYDDRVQQGITYDAGAKSWIYENWHSMGGYNLYTSPGLKGDAAVWTDHSFLPSKNVRAISTYTMRRIGSKKYVGTFAITNAKGTKIAVEDTCTKR